MNVEQKKYSPWLVSFVVSIATFMEILDTTIVNVALGHIAGSLGCSQEESTWVITAYLVSNAIVLPLSGWLANAFGRKAYFMVSIFFFALSSLACGLADSLLLLVIFRFIQGISGGGLQPLQQAIVLDAFPPEKRATGFAITGITVVIAPVLGPTLGGYIADNYSWQWIFFINIPVGIIALFLVNMVVSDPTHSEKGFKGSMDFIGLGLVALALGSFQIVIDKGQIEDWFESNFIITMTSICVISFIACIAWLLSRKDPVIDLSLFKIRSYSVACLIMFIAGFILYSSTVILPFLVQTQFGYDATTAGLVLSPGAIVVVFLMAVVGKLSGSIQPRYLLLVGFAFIAVGQYAIMHFSPDTDYWTFVYFRFLQVIGLPFIFIPVSTVAFMNIPKEKYNKASAIFALTRNLGGSVGIAVITTILSRYSNIWQNYLSARTTPNNPEYQEYLSNMVKHFIFRGFNHIDAKNLATAKIYRELIRQATLLAYVECMYFTFILTLLLIPILILVPKIDMKAKREHVAIE